MSKDAMFSVRCYNSQLEKCLKIGNGDKYKGFTKALEAYDMNMQSELERLEQKIRILEELVGSYKKLEGVQ